jgi:SAM-dependent methyltransferase
VLGHESRANLYARERLRWCGTGEAGVSATEPHADPVTVAAQHAGLGLPVPRRTRLRFLKRVMARLGRLVIHHQVAYNHAMIAALDRLRGVHVAAEMRIGNEIGALRSDLQAVHEAALEALIDSTRVAAQLDAADLRARQVEDHMMVLAGTTNEFRAQLEAIQRSAQARHSLVDLFLRQLRREYPMKPDPERLVELPSGDDDFYEALEDVFRGSFEQVTDWQRPYLTDLEGMSSAGRVLDIGSGRGEWLGLLAGAGIDAYGIDLNLRAAERCRDRGLEVVHGDALDHLAALPDASLAAVTGFQVVEHLPFDTLVDLLDHAVRVLRPGGILILETPNPTNVIVGSAHFLLDPSHQKLVHPLLLEFLFSTRGFDDIEVRYLHPAQDAFEHSDHSEMAQKPVEPMLDRLNVMFFGPQDYAVLGCRMSD